VKRNASIWFWFVLVLAGAQTQSPGVTPPELEKSATTVSRMAIYRGMFEEFESQETTRRAALARLPQSLGEQPAGLSGVSQFQGSIPRSSDLAWRNQLTRERLMQQMSEIQWRNQWTRDRIAQQISDMQWRNQMMRSQLSNQISEMQFRNQMMRDRMSTQVWEQQDRIAAMQQQREIARNFRGMDDPYNRYLFDKFRQDVHYTVGAVIFHKVPPITERLDRTIEQGQKAMELFQRFQKPADSVYRSVMPSDRSFNPADKFLQAIEKPYWDEANRLVKDHYTSQIATRDITMTRTRQPETRSGWWAPAAIFEGNRPLFGNSITIVHQRYELH
jgi:hypothetical protein